MTTSDQAARRAQFYAALRSERFSKITNRLVRGDDKACAMGVATVVAMENGAPLLRRGDSFIDTTTGKEWVYTMPECLVAWYGFPSRNPVIGDIPVTEANDRREGSFEVVARLLAERYPAEASLTSGFAQPDDML